MPDSLRDKTPTHKLRFVKQIKNTKQFIVGEKLKLICKEISGKINFKEYLILSKWNKKNLK